MGSSSSTEHKLSPEQYSTLLQIPDVLEEAPNQTTEHEFLRTPGGQKVQLVEGISKDLFLDVSEVTFWRSLFVLAHNSREYGELLKEFQSRNNQKLRAILDYNGDLLNVIEMDLNYNFPEVKKARSDDDWFFLNRDVHRLTRRVYVCSALADKRELEEIQNRVNDEMMKFGKGLEEAGEEVRTNWAEHEELQKKFDEAFAKEQEELRKELEEQMDKLNKEHEELMNKLEQEREKIKKEATEMTRKSLKEMHLRTRVFLECVQMKLRFEEKEDEWKSWLNVLNAATVRVKIQYSRFKQKATFSEKKLYQLHLVLHSAQTLFYNAYFLIKDLSARAPDRLFLKVLQRDLAQNADTLFLMLILVENIIQNKRSVEPLDCSFKDYEKMEIPSTWKLRELERTTPSDEFDGIEIEDPLQFYPELLTQEDNSPENHGDNPTSDSENLNKNGNAKENDIITGNEANHSSGIALEKRNELADIEQQIENEQIECEKEKKRLRNAAAEEELEANKVHGAKMLEKAEEKKRVGAEGEQRLNKLALEEIELEKMVLEKQNDLKAVIMNNALALMNAQNDEQSYEDFRRNCRRLVNSFIKFSGALSKAELNLVSNRAPRHSVDFQTQEPNMNSVLRILREFTENLQLFTPEGAYEPLKFGDLRNEVLGMATELNDGLTKMGSRIQAYRQARDAPQFVQRITSSRSMTESEDEGFTALSTPPASSRSSPPLPNMSSFSITALHKTVSETNKKLQMEMMKFNLPASDRFDQTFRSQTETLALDQSRLTIGQLRIASSSRVQTGQNRLEQSSATDDASRSGPITRETDDS